MRTECHSAAHTSFLFTLNSDESSQVYLLRSRATEYREGRSVLI